MVFAGLATRNWRPTATPVSRQTPAGNIPVPGTYGASKAFVLSLSQALWAETRGSGVTVTTLCPGPTRTGFVDALGSNVSHTAIGSR
jgi:short-subunit dehydrogenase